MRSLYPQSRGIVRRANVVKSTANNAIAVLFCAAFMEEQPRPIATGVAKARLACQLGNLLAWLCYISRCLVSSAQPSQQYVVPSLEESLGSTICRAAFRNAGTV